MKILTWDEDSITFSDGSSIRHEHEQDCCERNYADFSVLDIMYGGEEFEDYEVEFVDYGFNLVMVHGKWERSKIYIPFYSEQNGYYSDECDLVFDRKTSLKVIGRKALEISDDGEFE